MAKIFRQVITDSTFDILKEITELKSFSGFYLAGGTSLALQIGHRHSEDLDFFIDVEFKSNLIQKLKMQYKVVTLADNAIELIVDETKLLFFYFAFPRHEELVHQDGLRLAHPVDIGLNKLLALQGRTTKKDIIDLYFIDREILPLEQLFKLFEDFYPKESFNVYQSVKQLLNPAVLDQQPMPKMLKYVEWEEVYGSVGKKIAEQLKRLIDN